MDNIIYPTPPLYFVTWTDAEPEPIVAHGKVESDQCMATGLVNVETFENEQDYLDRLSNFNIIP